MALRADNFVLSGGSISGSLDGGGGANSLSADNTANVWDINGADAGSLNGFAFTHIGSLIGSTNTDSFVFFSGGSLSGSIDGGTGGGNSIDLSALTAATVQLNSDTANGYAGTSSVGVTNFSNIDSITSAAGGTLKSNLGTAASWTISGGSSGTVANGGNNLTFAGFSILDADNHGDSFYLRCGGLRRHHQRWHGF